YIRSRSPAQFRFVPSGSNRQILESDADGGTSAESCVKSGLDPAAIERVVVSHLHFNQNAHIGNTIGDCALFTSVSFTLGGGGQAAIEDGEPGSPKSTTLAAFGPISEPNLATTTPDRTVSLTSADFDTSIGPFPHTVDYFSDGSIYIINTPGVRTLR
ncbi:hypothetical protein C8R44DRAFT_942414, partial [Mycena epipterygia]